MVIEGTLGKLKSRFRALLTTCESRKETMKAIDLSCVILLKIFIERGDIQWALSNSNSQREFEFVRIMESSD